MSTASPWLTEVEWGLIVVGVVAAVMALGGIIAAVAGRGRR